MGTSGMVGDMHIVCLAVCYSDVTICSKCEKKKKKKLSQGLQHCQFISKHPAAARVSSTVNGADCLLLESWYLKGWQVA